MERDEAAMLWARLVVHFPVLGNDIGEAANELRTRDWIETIARHSYEDGCAVVGLLVSSWTENRHPRIGDYNEIARQRLLRRGTAPRALPDGAVYQCSGGCHDTGWIENTSGTFDVGNEGRLAVHVASPDSPVMTRCPVCKGTSRPHGGPTGPMPTRERVAEIVAGMKETLANAKGPLAGALGQVVTRRPYDTVPQDFKLPAPALTYEQVYDEEGNPRPEHAEELAAMAKRRSLAP